MNLEIETLQQKQCNQWNPTTKHHPKACASFSTPSQWNRVVANKGWRLSCPSSLCLKLTTATFPSLSTKRKTLRWHRLTGQRTLNRHWTLNINRIRVPTVPRRMLRLLFWGGQPLGWSQDQLARLEQTGKFCSVFVFNTECVLFARKHKRQTKTKTHTKQLAWIHTWH